VPILLHLGIAAVEFVLPLQILRDVVQVQAYLKLRITSLSLLLGFIFCCLNAARYGRPDGGYCCVADFL